jgi:hypothetical protein
MARHESAPAPHTSGRVGPPVEWQPRKATHTNPLSRTLRQARTTLPSRPLPPGTYWVLTSGGTVTNQRHLRTPKTLGKPRVGPRPGARTRRRRRRVAPARHTVRGADVGAGLASRASTHAAGYRRQARDDYELERAPPAGSGAGGGPRERARNAASRAHAGRRRPGRDEHGLERVPPGRGRGRGRAPGTSAERRKSRPRGAPTAGT